MDPEDFVKLDVIVQNPPATFNATELETLANTFTSPLVKRYLDTLLWNSMRELSSMPITEIGTPKYNYFQAYVKGSIGLLLTLGSITVPKKRKAQPARVLNNEE